VRGNQGQSAANAATRRGREVIRMTTDAEPQQRRLAPQTAPAAVLSVGKQLDEIIVGDTVYEPVRRGRGRGGGGGGGEREARPAGPGGGGGGGFRRSAGGGRAPPAPARPRAPRTNRTRRVPHPVLIGHAASLAPY
jgi:hypothetical protein